MPVVHQPVESWTCRSDYSDLAGGELDIRARRTGEGARRSTVDADRSSAPRLPAPASGSAVILQTLLRDRTSTHARDHEAPLAQQSRPLQRRQCLRVLILHRVGWSEKLVIGNIPRR